MKFGEFLKKFAIPEWRYCYINYKLFKKIIQIIKLSHQAKSTLKQNSETNHIQVLNKIQIQSNQYFFTLHKRELELTFAFLQMKIIQLIEKYKLFETTQKQKGDKKFLYDIQTLYVEVSYLKNLDQINVLGQKKILKKHKKLMKNIKLPLPKSRAHKILRLSPQIKLLISNLQQLYVSHSDSIPKFARQKIRSLTIDKSQDTTASFLFGTGLGIGLSLIIIIITALTLKGINLQSDAYFKRDFPVWRGMSYFIIYMWVLGFNVYAFEKKIINHKLIFGFKDFHASKSTDIFERASLFSAVFLILMLLYVLQKLLVDFEYLHSYQPYFASIVWLMFVVYLVFPLPFFNFKGRLYMFKLMFSAVVAPFYRVNFAIVWITDQFVSLITPLKDFAYTICYYTHLNLNEDPRRSGYINPCSSNTNFQVVFLVGLIVYLYRIMQCIKLGIDTNSYFFKPNFFNTVKYAMSLITLIFSYSYSSQNPIIFYFWILFASISTIYSYIWDLKMDWGLLETNSKNKYLRDILIYQNKWIYYTIVVVNFFLRLSWIFTLSPNITASFNISPVIFSLITGTLEIIRRGIWNLLRVQKQHISNCLKFKALQEIDLTQRNISEVSPMKQEQDYMVQNRLSGLKISLNKHVEAKRKVENELQEYLSKNRKEIQKINKQAHNKNNEESV